MSRKHATPPLSNATHARTTVAPHTQRTQQLTHIRELDGLRGIAALMVFFHHIWFTSYHAGGTGLIRWAAWASEYGRTGVDLFFVLSGFLITSLLIKARSSKRYYQDFYWKRVLRVLPLYVVCLLGVALFQRGSLPGVAMAALFLANFSSVFHIASTGPFWTLAIEEQFYILWPTVVRRRSVDRLQHWALLIGVGCMLLRAGSAWFGHYNYYLSFLRCDGLAFGALLACWFMQGGERLGSAPRERITLALAPIAGAVFVALGLAVHTTTPRAIAMAAAALQTGVTLLAGAAVGVLIRFRGASWLAIFRGSILTFFGLISYALYMTHVYVLEVWDRVTGTPHGSNAAFVLRTGGILALSIALALLSRYALELPALRLRRYVLPPQV